jgi:hypothetical protein
MREIREFYRRIGDETDRFDIEFWQAQGDQAIFDAALDMIRDYLALRYGHADEPRLQRTVEHFGKADLIRTKEASARDQDLTDVKKLRRADGP